MKTTHIHRLAACFLSLLLLVPLLCAPTPASAASFPEQQIIGFANGVHDSKLLRLYVFTDPTLKQRNSGEFVDVLTDQLEILFISWENHSILIRYPVKNGTKDRWIPMIALFPSNERSDIKEYRATSKIATFRGMNLKQSYGSIFANESFFLWETRQNGAVRVLYPLDRGGYKLAFISADALSSASPVYANTSAADSAVIFLNVPSFKQYDSRWANTKIGTKTIKQIGCLLTCSAMLYTFDTNTITTPLIMKQQKVSFSNNDLIWSSLTRYGYSRTVYNQSISQSILSKIYASLQAGNPVIIGGGNARGGQHWVVVTGYNGSITSFSPASFSIHDPNSTRKNLQQFLASYPTVKAIVC